MAIYSYLVHFHPICLVYARKQIFMMWGVGTAEKAEEQKERRSRLTTLEQA